MNNQQRTIVMSNIFFSKESKDRLITDAIAGSTLESFFKFYSGYLLDSGEIDSKASCTSVVGKLISDAMNRGECSVVTLNNVKQYIREYQVKTKFRERKDNFKQLFSAICNEIASGKMDNLPSSVVASLNRYKELCDEKSNIESQLMMSLKDYAASAISNAVGNDAVLKCLDFDVK